MKQVIQRAAAWIFFCLAVSPFPVFAEPVLTFTTVKDAHFKAPIVEVMTQAYQRLGFRIQIVEQYIQRSLTDAGQGIYDGELFRVKGIESIAPNLIMVDVPCFELDVFIFTPREKRFTVDGWQSVPKGYTMVAPFAVKYIDRCIKANGLSAFFVKTPEETLGFLLSGKADFTLFTRKIDTLLIDKGLDNKLIRLTPAIDRVQVFHYLHSKNAGLVDQVGRILKEMHRDGTIDAFVSRWEKPFESPQSPGQAPDIK